MPNSPVMPTVMIHPTSPAPIGDVQHRAELAKTLVAGRTLLFKVQALLMLLCCNVCLAKNVPPTQDQKAWEQQALDEEQFDAADTALPKFASAYLTAGQKKSVALLQGDKEDSSALHESCFGQETTTFRVDAQFSHKGMPWLTTNKALVEEGMRIAMHRSILGTDGEQLGRNCFSVLSDSLMQWPKADQVVIEVTVRAIIPIADAITAHVAKPIFLEQVASHCHVPVKDVEFSLPSFRELDESKSSLQGPNPQKLLAGAVGCTALLMVACYKKEKVVPIDSSDYDNA